MNKMLQLISKLNLEKTFLDFETVGLENGKRVSSRWNYYNGTLMEMLTVGRRKRRKIKFSDPFHFFVFLVHLNRKEEIQYVFAKEKEGMFFTAVYKDNLSLSRPLSFKSISFAFKEKGRFLEVSLTNLDKKRFGSLVKSAFIIILRVPVQKKWIEWSRNRSLTLVRLMERWYIETDPFSDEGRSLLKRGEGFIVKEGIHKYLRRRLEKEEVREILDEWWLR